MKNFAASGAGATVPPQGSAPASGFTVIRTDATYDGPTTYCRKVTVRNDSGATGRFRVALTVQGTVTNATNASFTQTGQTLDATGLAATAPAGTSDFDFCAAR